MAFSYPGYGLGPNTGAITAFSPQPTEDAAFEPAGTQGRRDVGQVQQGFDRVRFRWNRMSNAQYLALAAHWTSARTTAGKYYCRYYKPTTNSVVTEKCTLEYPDGTPFGTDGTAPRWRDIEVTCLVGVP